MNAESVGNSDEQAAIREVRYKHARDFLPVLNHVGASLLNSTCHAGKVAVVSSTENGLQLSFHNFEQPMGVAVPQRRSHFE